MKDYIKSAKSGLIFGFSALLIFVLGTGVYAGWTSISKAKSSDILKAEDWNKILDNLDYLKEGAIAVPANGVLAFYSESCPAGWKPANGSNNTPDLRGKFIRGLNSFEAGQNKLTGDDSDIDGKNRTLGSFQNDAIRNITGSQGGLTGQNDHSNNTWTGAFYIDGISNHQQFFGTTPGGPLLKFDASRSVGIEHVGKDNRPKNIGLIYY